jgi:ribonuclease J
MKVWGTRLTLGLVKAKFDEFDIADGSEFTEINHHDKIKIGSFEIEPIRVNHSVPDAVGYAIRTKQGIVIHSGDYKIDQTPTDGLPTDFHAFARYGAEGVIALLVDTTNCTEEGYSGSERVVEEALREIIEEAPGRVIMTTFASNIAGCSTRSTPRWTWAGRSRSSGGAWSRTRALPASWTASTFPTACGWIPRRSTRFRTAA